MLTLKTRRDVIRRFKDDQNLAYLEKIYYLEGYQIQQVLRDFLNGKFSLEPKREASKSRCPNCGKRVCPCPLKLKLEPHQ